MRICFVSRRFFPAISGMSVYAANLLRELVRMGHDVTMVSQYRGDELGTRIYGGGPPPPVPGVRVVGLEALGEQCGGDFEEDVATMVETIVAEHGESPFDVIHAQYGYPTGLAALEAGRKLGVPNLVSIQGGDGHWVGGCCATHKRAMLAVLGHAGALLIPTRSFADEVTEKHGTPTERFTIIPNAVDTARFAPVEGRKLGEVGDGPTLLYHGRVDRRKGALVLLDAFADLARERPRVRLAVSGIGPDSDAVAGRVRELGLEDRIDLLGYASYDEVPAVYRGGDVFVSPTFAEGFSNTILEAMAVGLPIVSTRAVGVVDCLRHGENALLAEPGSAGSLASELRRMLDEAPLRARLTEQALHEVRTLYSWPSVAAEIVGVYQNLLGTHPDTDWSADGPIDPCRFRETPHLL
ncbi:glycosyltransferase [Rubrobacter marinus]|uniref:Glycosyltransferase n=1 Tax=Rubrobacter marinus TaxID=2653852 RepID=A0A6G8Q1J7_9ACTN|nr:glycosyltransferase family 4 protein [Rubrobacter marinus]QIN80343.1 glycosyltransferase [Rubrobacter marinus]